MQTQQDREEKARVPERAGEDAVEGIRKKTAPEEVPEDQTAEGSRCWSAGGFFTSAGINIERDSRGLG